MAGEDKAEVCGLCIGIVKRGRGRDRRRSEMEMRMWDYFLSCGGEVSCGGVFHAYAVSRFTCVDDLLGVWMK